MTSNIASTVAKARKRAEKQATRDQKEYLRMEFARSGRFIRWIRFNPAAAQVFILIIFLGFAGVLIATNLFVQSNILGMLALLDIAFLGLAFAFVTAVESIKSSMSAMYRWQKVAEHLQNEAAQVGLSPRELRCGLRAIAENRKVEERLIVAAFAAGTAFYTLTDKLYEEGNPVKSWLVERIVPAAEHWGVIALIVVAGFAIYLVRYLAPAQWDRQLFTFLDEKDPENRA